jgi:hypothetical protein
MSKADYYRLLAKLNKSVVDGRERVAAQKQRVFALAELPACSGAVGLLRILDHSLRLMIQRRAMVIEQLMNWPNYGEAEQPVELRGRNPINGWGGLVQVFGSYQSTHRRSAEQR